jgi:endo-1,4-beta-xylanase
MEEDFMKKVMFFVFLVWSIFVAQAQSDIVKNDFENGQQGDWANRGSARVSVSAQAAHAGTASLFTTGRSQGWNGPSLDLTGKLLPGGTYTFSAWVMIPAGQSANDMIMTIERVKSGTTSWDRIVSAKVTPGAWFNLTGDYDAKSDFDKILVYIESSDATLEYYIDDITITVVKAPRIAQVNTEVENLPSLYKAYQRNFQIGTCVEPNQLTGKEVEMLTRHFSSLTAENAMKPGSISNGEGKYNFTNADKIVAFARANRRLVRGHTLVWHQQAANWMFVDKNGRRATKAVLLRRLEKYIKAVVGHFKGKVYAWDVVNEVIDGAALRNSDWYAITGEEYIEKAFIWARRADPKAKLFINDYNTTNPVKRQALFNLIKKLKSKKIPVDGIGLQFHIDLRSPSLKEIDDSLKKFSTLGIEIHITELDMSVNADPGFTADQAPENAMIRQAYRYKEIFDIFKKYKAVTSVTFWGFQDGHTWLTYSPVKKMDWPLLFDKNLKAKYAYHALIDPGSLPPDVDISQVITKRKNDFISTAVMGTPVMDGIEDAPWKSAPEININVMVDGKGATGVGKALWDKGHLYVFVKVKDDTLSKKSKDAWQQDSIEVFVDEKNNKSVEYQDDDAQYRVNFDNEVSTAGQAAAIKSAAVVTTDGYDVELMIPFQTIKPSSGTSLGFDLQINDDSGTGTRTSIAKWNDPTNESYRDTSGFGTLILK